MNDFSSSLEISRSGMQAQASRLRHVSENVANADTPGYRRKLTFFEAGTEGAVALGRTQLDTRASGLVYEPGHPLANADGYREGSNVDLVIELADAKEAQRSYEANLKMFDQARKMSSALLDVLRK